MEMEKNKKNRYGFDFTPIGLDIKTFREAQKITREKLAETLDISPRHLQAIELEGKHPSLGLLAYIATIFDMPIDPYIFPEKADAKSVVNNFMRCHRFDLVRCRKPTRFPVTGPIVYTIIHLPVYGSFLDSFLHSAPSNYLTSLDAAFCILVGNCAQAIHNSQAGRPVYPGRPAFPFPFLKLSPFPTHFAKQLFCV